MQLRKNSAIIVSINESSLWSLLTGKPRELHLFLPHITTSSACADVADKMVHISGWSGVCPLVEIWQVSVSFSRCVCQLTPVAPARPSPKWIHFPRPGKCRPWSSQGQFPALQERPLHHVASGLGLCDFSPPPPPYLLGVALLFRPGVPSLCPHHHSYLPFSAWVLSHDLLCPSPFYTQLKPHLCQADPHTHRKTLPPVSIVSQIMFLILSLNT